MAAHITPAEARRLGITVPASAKRRTTKTEAKGTYHTRCTRCSVEFTTVAAEDRHLAETGHPRYELVR